MEQQPAAQVESSSPPCSSSSWVRQAFRAFDASGEGRLRMEGLKCAITALLGSRPTKYQVNQLFIRHDVDRGIDEEAFVEVMGKKMALRDRRDDSRQVFRAFDGRQRGFLTVEDVLEAFGLVWPSVPVQTVQDAFAEVDVDRRGRIGLQQFEWVMQRSRGRPYSAPYWTSSSSAS